MNVIYYRQNGSGFCPVKQYLRQYQKKMSDRAKQWNRKARILANIDSKIKHLAEIKGMPAPSIAKKMTNYGYFEIICNGKINILIRIFYFYHSNRIVLLNVLEKPSRYNPGRETRKIKRAMDITEEYRNDFILNPQSTYPI